MKNIDDMLYYLMLEGSGRGTGVEYGVNKCHDMVTIIACLIDAGCHFNNPEQVSFATLTGLKLLYKRVIRVPRSSLLILVMVLFRDTSVLGFIAITEKIGSMVSFLNVRHTIMVTLSISFYTFLPSIVRTYWQSRKTMVLQMENIQGSWSFN